MFFKKGKGALWVCMCNEGGGGPKEFVNNSTIQRKRVCLVSGGTGRHTGGSATDEGGNS